MVTLKNLQSKCQVTGDDDSLPNATGRMHAVSNGVHSHPTKVRRWTAFVPTNLGKAPILITTGVSGRLHLKNTLSISPITIPLETSMIRFTALGMVGILTIPFHNCHANGSRVLHFTVLSTKKCNASASHHHQLAPTAASFNIFYLNVSKMPCTDLRDRIRWLFLLLTVGDMALSLLRKDWDNEYCQHGMKATLLYDINENAFDKTCPDVF